MLKLLALLLIVGIPTRAVLRHSNHPTALVFSIGIAFLILIVYDFVRLTRGTIRWRWRLFNFKNEFAIPDLYTETMVLGVAAWTYASVYEHVLSLTGP